jgi:fructokinase
MKFYGGIETGGTKTVCIVASSPEQIIAEERIPTSGPMETIQKMIDFFLSKTENYQLAAIGIASFGPVDLEKSSPTFGFVTTTPKPGWKNVDLYGQINKALKIPVAFDTDVNAAAFGEQYWAPGEEKPDPFIYITVGTGIGVGVIINGTPLHGLIHAEAGHMMVPHDLQKDPFSGLCTYHGDCLEGLASGPAMEMRWGKRAEALPGDHPGWELESDYLAAAMINLIYTYSPRQIVMGGGVSLHSGLLDLVRRKVVQLNNDYFRSEKLHEDIHEYIRDPFLGSRSGTLGAIAMAINLTRNE